MDKYDTGIINDFGGGNVSWWQDYLRSEVERCNDFHENQIEELEDLQDGFKTICELRNNLADKCNKLEDDIQEYKDVIDSLKQKIDVSECLYEDSKKEIKQLERRFPMIDGPDIDWVTAEYIYKMYSYLYGNSQSLERLAERGGYYWAEIAPIVIKYMKKKALEDKDG